MPCDAIVNARSRVSLGQLARLVTPEALKTLLSPLLTQAGHEVRRLYQFDNGIGFDLRYAGSMYTVVIEKNGENFTTQVSPWSASGNRQIVADLVGGLIQQVGAIRLNAVAALLLKRNGATLGRQTISATGVVTTEFET